MKIAIVVEYKDKVYTSDYIEYTEDKKKELISFIEKVVRGDVSFMSFKSYSYTHYFGENILKESIITLTEA